MEIYEIGKLSKVKPLQKSKQMARVKIAEDKVTLSPEALEAQKKMRFVEMVKEMAEISSLPKDVVTRIVAEKIYKEIS